jgi:UDP-glucose 4-epimerase
VSRAAARILITGASGFLGRHVCARLIADGEVFAVVRGGAAPAGCVPVQADLAGAFSTDGWPDRLDAVLHLAQSARHRDFPGGAADMTAINVAATATLIEYARRAGAATFIFASTGSVYTPGPQPAAEDDAVAPANFYAASKAAAECLLRPYRDLLRVCVLRLFYPYGPDQQGRLIPSLVERVRDGRPISLAGAQDGLVLTPTYVDDVAAIVAAAVADRRFDGAFNVSSPEIMTLRDVGTAIARVLGVDVRFENTGGAEPPRLLPNLARLAALYPLAAFTPFDAGLSRMLRAQPVAT